MPGEPDEPEVEGVTPKKVAPKNAPSKLDLMMEMLQTLSTTVQTIQERQDTAEAKRDAPTLEKPGPDKQTEGETAGAPAEDQSVQTFQGTREDRESAEDYAVAELLSVAMQADNPYTAGRRGPGTEEQPGRLQLRQEDMVSRQMFDQGAMREGQLYSSLYSLCSFAVDVHLELTRIVAVLVDAEESGQSFAETIEDVCRLVNTQGGVVELAEEQFAKASQDWQARNSNGLDPTGKFALSTANKQREHVKEIVMHIPQYRRDATSEVMENLDMIQKLEHRHLAKRAVKASGGASGAGGGRGGQDRQDRPAAKSKNRIKRDQTRKADYDARKKDRETRDSKDDRKDKKPTKAQVSRTDKGKQPMKETPRSNSGASTSGTKPVHDDSSSDSD